MVSAEDKRDLVKLARKGKMESDQKGPGFRDKFTDLVKAGISGPGHDYGLDYSDKPYYRTALWEASWKNQELMCRMLLDKGATIDWSDYQGRTPLHEAAYYGYLGLCELFLERGHPIDPLDNFGQTPLFRAVDASRDAIVKLLLERKATLNRLDTDGVTPQHVASFSGDRDMSQYLLYKGAWKNRFSIQENPPDKQNRASASNAKDPAKKTMVTEVEEQPESKEPVSPALPPAPAALDEVAPAEEKKASKSDEGRAEDSKVIPRSEFSAP